MARNFEASINDRLKRIGSWRVGHVNAKRALFQTDHPYHQIVFSRPWRAR